MFRIKSRDLLGRTGVLTVKRDNLSIETPYLFPVIDIKRQEVHVKEIERLGFNGVITNAYLLYKRGNKNKLHEVLNASHTTIIMTDSGAYQLLEYGDIDVDNKTIIEYQKNIGSDIAVILDHPTGDSTDLRYAEETVKTTLSRAKEALEVIDGNRLWVLPIQGGIHLDILKWSTKESNKLTVYDIYALGSPTRMLENYNYIIVAKMILTVRTLMPYDKPLHLFGAGHPMIIPFAVALGVDLFDSASYILFARDDRYMTETGTRRLEDLEYFPCSCPVCSRYSPKELRELDKNERTRLLAFHNLYTIRKILNKTKQAIKEGLLWELLSSMAEAHPALKSIFRLMKKDSRKIARYSPLIPDNPRAPSIIGKNGIRNPTVQNSLMRLDPTLKWYMEGSKRTIITHACFRNSCKKLYEELKEECSRDRTCRMLLLINSNIVLPAEMDITYPLGHASNYITECYYYAVKLNVFIGRETKTVDLIVPRTFLARYKNALEKHHGRNNYIRIGAIKDCEKFAKIQIML